MNLLGYSNLQVADYGSNPNGQGPYLAFVLPTGAYTPDSKGVITVSSVDVEAVLSWAVKNYPNYYPNTIYLTELNLAQEVMTLNGTFTPTFASFEVQATGAAVGLCVTGEHLHTADQPSEAKLLFSSRQTRALDRDGVPVTRVHVVLAPGHGRQGVDDLVVPVLVADRPGRDLVSATARCARKALDSQRIPVHVRRHERLG